METFRQHNRITGAIVLAIGITGFIGSITGQLAPMIAALFAPQYLAVDPSAASPSSAGGLLGELNSIAQGLLTTNPITGLAESVIP